MTQYTLCADDFGLHQSVDDGIISLVKAGRLNAVSCMSIGKTLSKNAQALLEASKESSIPVQIGLHLTFTEYAPVGDMPILAPDGGFPTIEALIQYAHLGRLNQHEISTQINRQLDVFKDTFGTLPDFIDGHQHAHILPTIREALVSTAKSNMSPDGWIRSCDLPFSEIIKTKISVKRALIISVLSRRLKTMLFKNAIKTNGVFYGVNDFTSQQDFAQMMQVWLHSAGKSDKSALIMCHPGQLKYPNDKSISDPIADRRPDELSYLASEQFLQDMRNYKVELG
ncbi:ChbG/HpnK family deacetylase [Amylibacter sp. SFDW26]|uniref:ChbG/HpnK family deacetylase n=1 Tax=Amylibacter sp. SFDW26 TaxID=2652722 RepID=UPI00126255F4|nr:ChbG/HpnK family deacetylase [Amylibacter sp. SFDW26]KAB7614407.1 ChbG/HpnK family deacetylase [Amylibacter sp. SFDW26]